MTDPLLTVPFRREWPQAISKDEFEAMCAAFWEAHSEPMLDAVTAFSDGRGSDGALFDAVRVGMRAALERLRVIIDTREPT